MKNQTTGNKGITLIALIITIIVMLILVGVTVNVALNGGLFGTAQEAGKQTELEADRETLQAGTLGAMDTETLEIPNKQELKNNLPEPWTVDGEGPYTVTSPNNNVFTVDIKGNITVKEENSGTTGDLALLEKYFLGEDGKGRKMNGEVMDENFTKFNPYGLTKEERPEEKLEFLSYGIRRTRTEGDKYYGIYEFYVKYENMGYKVSAKDSNQGKITESVEKVYEPKGKEGQDLGTVTGDSQHNGWTILYDNGNEVEAVAPGVIGQELTLGDTDLNKAIYSYNNAITTINDYCKNLTGLPTNNGVRSVGAEEDPVPNLEDNNAYNEIPIEWENSFFNRIGKIGDSSYEQDLIRMSYHKKLNINKEYWLASRLVYAESDLVDFQVRNVRGLPNEGSQDTRNYFGGLGLWAVESGGTTPNTTASCGVRPIIKVSI